MLFTEFHLIKKRNKANTIKELKKISSSLY